ncbi:Verru_Chthon cassette protein B [Terrimicrobium sacchariphilum]|jgi:uncharacterized protein (TIGR02598 family)|uniref:Verru_Chthon cassette protein B n=1 Tax=Terrimicrobium sacchariphilum TaxID=690879 RepID=A0A146G7X6_TERSA|nr:Verru_Chthon cassette protein B [Terrimicrobium sacchariphilum]GAT33591.1 Verru_Chthon cassette protein B [Terrimicrobium sacchariphilum]
MISSRNDSRALRRSGFTLIEVTISLGIVAFAMVSLVGLLPAGLSNFRMAMSQTIESQIVQGLSEEIALTDFSNLADLEGRKFTYDNSGVTTRTGDPATIYTATVKLEPVDSLSSYPVRLQDSASRNEAYNVRIQISRVNQTQQINQYSLIVANKRGHASP